MKVFNRIALVARVVSEQIADSLRLVERFLLEHGKEVYIESNSATMFGESASIPKTINEIGDCCDLVIAVGGDGNILSCAREMAPFGVPILGVNRGKLGFLADISPEDIDLINLVEDNEEVKQILSDFYEKNNIDINFE